VLPQFVSPLPQAQAPLVQVAPGPQTLLQAPQLFGSMARLKQFPLQEVKPALQEPVHCPLTQAPVPLTWKGQTLPHMPQLFGSAAVLTQLLPHATKLVLHDPVH
jgi:hypothetical protein